MNEELLPNSDDPIPQETHDTELWDPDPNCEHDIVNASGGGVKCTKCRGWFCH